MNISAKTIFVTPATAALATGLSLNAIYLHIKVGNLAASKMQGFKEWMIRQQDLQEFVAAKAVGRFTHQWKQAREGKPARTKKQRLLETFNGSKILTVPSEEKA
jgi:hypothetical protein